MRKQELMNNTELNFKIALDGPSASGKGLIGSMLAQEFSLQYIQSSILYRGLAYLVKQQNIELSDHKKIVRVANNSNIFDQVENVDLNDEKIATIASKIAVIADIRAVLTKILHDIALNTARIIIEGRDIGTVILPNADLKIFLTANINIRAERRYNQLQSQGKTCMLNDVLKQLTERDKKDLSRSCSPLKQASGALYIDSSSLTAKEVVLKIKEYLLR